MARQGSVIIMDGVWEPVRQGSLIVHPPSDEIPSRGGSGGKGASPSGTVADLDGSSSPGTSEEYSRGDHKHGGGASPLGYDAFLIYI